jgi:hypothetical protein
MIISKPPNKVYDEQWERIYGRRPSNPDTSCNENADECNTGINSISELPEITTTGTE